MRKRKISETFSENQLPRNFCSALVQTIFSSSGMEATCGPCKLQAYDDGLLNQRRESDKKSDTMIWGRGRNKLKAEVHSQYYKLCFESSPERSQLDCDNK